MYGNYQPYQMPMFQNPYQARLDAMQPPVAQRCEITRVNGRNGAEAYQLPPNSSNLLLDETAPIVWLVQTDGAGYKSLTPYTISPYQAAPPVDVQSLEERVKKLEEMIYESYSANARTSKKRTDDGE
jgi:hypothetical protein